MRLMIKRTFIVGAAVLLLGTPVAVSALEGEGSGSTDDKSTSSPTTAERTEKQKLMEQRLQNQLQQQKDKRLATLEDKREDLKERLEGAKKKACENRQSAINRVMKNMNDRRENAFERITKISDAVQAFYEKKQLSVANYEDLVAAVDAAKAVAQTAMNAQQSVPALNCSSDQPRADMSEFKERRSGSIDAMKAYRDAVKALLKAVREAASSAKQSTQPTEGGNE